MLAANVLPRLRRIAPGLDLFFNYRRENLRHDVQAGVSVAAVAVPVGIAYAQLAGFPPAIGLYSTILSMVAYALFGSSRQLMVGPDAATCALVAATLAPLAQGDSGKYEVLSVALTFLTGVFCILASRLKLGVLADFLSRPILTGFLNGIAVSIMLGQVGKLLGFTLDAQGVWALIVEIIQRLPNSHWPTLGVALGTFAVLTLSRRFLPRLPAVLVAMSVATLVVGLFGLQRHGVAVVGEVPAGLPHLMLPELRVPEIARLVFAAAGIALVSFSSATLTTRSFAAKNGYEVDTDRELAALGAANIGSALLGGFAISGADSRTATNDAAGGRTQFVSVVTAVTVGATLLFLTPALAFLPIAALGAVLVSAAMSLVDLKILRWLFRASRGEFALAIGTLFGVVVIGVIDAILIAVMMALLRFIRASARPRLQVLGRSQSEAGWYPVSLEQGLAVQPGVLLLRFDGPLVFFNAPHFKQEVLATVAHAPNVSWVVLDMLPVSKLDVTGITTLFELGNALHARGVRLTLAGRREELLAQAERRGIELADAERGRIFPTLKSALRAYRMLQAAPAVEAAPEVGSGA